MSLHALFHPRGVAFVGATPDPERYGGRVVQYCVREGFGGGIYAVNPKYSTIFDVPCYPDLAAIPGPVDVVVVLVGPRQVPGLLEQCRAKGVTVTLKKMMVGTELRIEQTNVPAAIPLEACYLGWQESLEYLAKLVMPEITD